MKNIEIEINNLEFNPLLKELLIMYVSRMYEECGIYDDEHLLAEYNLLKRNGELHLLFEEENFTNYMKNEYDK